MGWAGKGKRGRWVEMRRVKVVPGMGRVVDMADVEWLVSSLGGCIYWGWNERALAVNREMGIERCEIRFSLLSRGTDEFSSWLELDEINAVSIFRF